MITNTLQQCRKCGGAIHREHYAERIIGDDELETYTLCEFCGYGVETASIGGQQVLYIDYQESTEPAQFAAFERRLKEALAA